MPARVQRLFLIPANAGALPAPAFFICALVRPILGNGTGEGHSKLRVMRLLRVTSKLAMLPLATTSGADGARRLDDVGTVIAYA
jgi:hypothetical protein